MLMIVFGGCGMWSLMKGEASKTPRSSRWPLASRMSLRKFCVWLKQLDMEVVKSSGANAKIACLASFIFVLLSDTLYKSLLQSFEWLSSPPPPRSLWSPQNSYSIIATRSGNSSTLACSLIFHCSALIFASSFLLPKSFSWNNILVFSTKSFFQVLSWYLLSTLKIYVNGLEWDQDYV